MDRSADEIAFVYVVDPSYDAETLESSREPWDAERKDFGSDYVRVNKVAVDRLLCRETIFTWTFATRVDQSRPPFAGQRKNRHTGEPSRQPQQRHTKVEELNRLVNEKAGFESALLITSERSIRKIDLDISKALASFGGTC
ncbi:MAG: adenylosuccinase ade13 [Pleopsidium flavum]|nr:MAG: adenylosuccinase ade13 [Pleopsidium flavum]